MALTPKQLRELRDAPADAGGRVSVAIKLAGLTQTELAEAIGVTQPYVSDIARGRHATITVDNARRFAEYFGCTIEDLFPAKAQVA